MAVAKQEMTALTWKCSDAESPPQSVKVRPARNDNKRRGGEGEGERRGGKREKGKGDRGRKSGVETEPGEKG